jgi:antitoxin PrlF
MAMATVTTKGQITIPVEVEKGRFLIMAATHSVRELKGLFRGRRRKPVTIEEMNAVIARRASGSR